MSQNLVPAKISAFPLEEKTMSKNFKVIALLLLCAATIIAVIIIATREKGSPDTGTVSIRGYYQEPESIHNKETIILQGVSDGEFIEVKVQGTVTEFRFIRLGWDEAQNDLAEKETLHSIPTLKDATLLIKTYIPEGIPSEKLTWKSESGKQYEFLINEDGVDGESGLVWEFILE
jgi:hypothetical protein